MALLITAIRLPTIPHLLGLADKLEILDSGPAPAPCPLSRLYEQSKPHSHLFPPLGVPFPPGPSQVIRSFPTTPNDRSVILV